MWAPTRDFSLLPEKRIHWPRGLGPPLDFPTCGFDGTLCRQKGASACSLVAACARAIAWRCTASPAL